MRFRIQEKTVSEKEVDVDLPRYSRHDLDSVTIYSKLFSDEKGNVFRCSITIGFGWRKEDSVELEVRAIQSPAIGHDADYYLGFGTFESSESEWLDAVAKADSFMARIRGV
jgi:hypothetical protein